MTANSLRAIFMALSALALTGVGIALLHHESYLASRLAALVGAAVFASMRAGYILQVARERPQLTLGVAIAIGFTLVLALLLLLFPDPIFHFLAWLSGNPHAKTPF